MGGSVDAAAGAPAAPTANSASVTNVSSFTASWNTSSGADGYKLDVATSSDFSSGFVLNNLDIPGGSTVACYVTGLTASTAYHYRVRAYNASGSSVNSSTIDVTTLSPVTYAWIATSGSNDWTSASSWLPSRTTPDINDILAFDQGGSSTATNVPTQTISKLQVSANTVITLQPTNGANVLTIAAAADALTVSADSQLNIFGAANATNLTINVATGAKASISGAMTFDNNFVSGTAFTLTASDTGGITFSSGAVFTQNCPGNIFGSGTANSVVFASGSTFVQKFGSNPFGKTAPSSVVIFQSGSLFSVQGSTVNMSFSGRTYADLEINRTNFSDTATGSSPLTISNLSVLQGALSVSMGGGFNLLGNATVAAGASLTLNNNVTNASGKTIIVSGRLAGTATNYGNAAITISPMGTLAPGASSSSIGSLTFATPPTLNGTNYAKIDRNAGSPLADKVIVTSGTLSYGGTLVVTNIGASLQVNDTFTLFSAPGYAASGFNYLQLPDAYAWDTSELTNNGTIRVSAIGGAPAPEPIVVHPQPGQLVMSWTQPAFALASSTNVAGPYEKILGATSPYTNSTTNATLFFKLVYP